MHKSVLSFLAALVCPTAIAATVFPTKTREWSIDFTGGLIGHRTPCFPVEKTCGLLMTEHAGKSSLVSPWGEKQLTMTLDLPVEIPAVATGDLQVRGDEVLFQETFSGKLKAGWSWLRENPVGWKYESSPVTCGERPTTQKTCWCATSPFPAAHWRCPSRSRTSPPSSTNKLILCAITTTAT